MWIHAVNAKARALFKAQNIQSRQVDGEGDDAEDAPMTAVSNLESKFAAAAKHVAKRSNAQQRPGPRDVSRTPKRASLIERAETSAPNQPPQEHTAHTAQEAVQAAAPQVESAQPANPAS